MEYNIQTRKRLYERITNGLDKTGRGALKIVKNKLLGKGYQGTVYSYCDKRTCVAVKKMYLENRQARFLKNPFSNPALKYENFIELAAMRMTNELVLQKISPHFILHYKSTFKKREEGACTDKYIYSSKYYNEMISGSQTFSDWVKSKHDIEVWYNAYFQITTAIYCLQTYFNLTHLDLHSDNILVKHVKPGGVWKYKIGGKNYYVPNYGFIFFINDFGHAWIPDSLQSWIIRKKYAKTKSKKITRNFDILRLFRSTLDFSTSPATFKKIIQNVIEDLGTDKNFIHIIENIWEMYLFKSKRKTIESYNLDKSLNTKSLPKELAILVNVYI
jgi:hypothetical protein